MPRNLSVSIENDLSGGLNTQATGINFPTNACIETDNCIFHELGFVERRLGFDFEANYSTKTIDRAGKAIVAYNWKNVTGDGAINLLVLQVGSLLYFYAPTPNGSFSPGALTTTVDLEDFLPLLGSAGNIPLAECQFSVGLGYLIVTHPYTDPFYVTFDLSTQVATATAINIKVRDFEGVEDSLAIDERPSSLSDKHEYNLYNQGWFVNEGDYVNDFQSAMTAYPSNADVWWVYRDLDNLFDPTTVSTIYETGTSKAPSGHYIVDPFRTNRSAQSGVTVEEQSSGGARPSTSAFYSGRVWYAGTNANGYESKIYFSQIIENKHQLGNCYQASDPTSQTANVLVADDGGHLLIPGAGLIYKLVPVGNSLIVFAANGVWQITGSTGIGFTALDYAVPFLSSIRTFSHTSFVDMEGFPVWWSIEGIYTLTPNNTGFAINSITDKKIKEFYLDIPLSCKRNARGAYDPRKHVIQWLYNAEETPTIEASYNYSNILNFNTLSGSFYPWSTPTSQVKINSVFLSEGLAAQPSQDEVVVEGDSVEADGDQVILVNYGSVVLDSVNKFVTSYSSNFTFADTRNEDFLDWKKFGDNLDYLSYFITGYRMPTKGLQEFQSNYIYVFSDLSEIESTEFFLQGIWNFANSGNSGKFTNRQKINHSSGGNFDIVRNKLKIRGSGHAAQFKFTSSPGQPFNILGWSILESSNVRD